MKSEAKKKPARLILVAGGKGGVGKSTVSVAVIDSLLAQGDSPVLVESDTSNPDVFKMYGAELEHRLINLDNVEGWMELVNYADELRGRTIVVNTAARNNEGVEKFGKMLCDSLGELDRELITLWVVNRQRDSIELLRGYLSVMTVGTVHVVKNGYFGEDHKFELYNGSTTRANIEEAGGQTLFFPDLADRVADDLFSNRLTVEHASVSLPMGNRAELRRWRDIAHRVIGHVLAA